MGSRYLTGLADWLRAEGLAVVEYAGWQTRARSSGGYDPGRPMCVMWHHTASTASPQADADYCCKTSGDRPITNLLVARDGVVWVLAAGATNTNGKGGPVTIPPGATVPVDSMNVNAVGMELCNDGVGETYKVAQIDAAFIVSLCLTEHLGLPPDAVCTHAAWTLYTRKIDPARADAVAGPWWPAAVNDSGTWSLDDLRAELVVRAGETPPPMEDSVRSLVRHGTDTAWNAYVVHDGGKYWIPTNEALSAATHDFGYAPMPVDDVYMAKTGPVIGPNPPTADEWGRWTPAPAGVAVTQLDLPDDP